MEFGLFALSPVDGAVSTCVRVFVRVAVLGALGDVLRSGIAGPYGCSVCNVLRHLVHGAALFHSLTAL